jgi:ATP-binding cassette, subfamily C (CFTR/MRP), member 10
MQYMDVPRERVEGTVTVHSSWPKEGIIEFEQVSLRYKPTLPAALNNVSFRIMGGLKVLFFLCFDYGYENYLSKN